jgi:hypothetical protein
MNSLPDDPNKRNDYPMADGLLYYFPNALAEVARVSKIGNDQHNPGQPMHWARGKSTDHANKIIRHLLDAGTMDKDGTRHSAKVAWRALALLQEELEREEGAPLPRSARLPDKEVVKDAAKRKGIPSRFVPRDEWIRWVSKQGYDLSDPLVNRWIPDVQTDVRKTEEPR